MEFFSEPLQKILLSYDVNAYCPWLLKLKTSPFEFSQS